MKKTIKKTKPANRRLANSSPIQLALRNSELRYRRLFETAQDGILILDAETGAITDVNPYLINMLGYSREEFIEKKLWEVGAFKDIQASKDAFEVLQRNDYIRYEDLPLKAKDGRLIQVEFVSNVYRVGDAQVIQCNIRDITEHKRLVAAMQENEKRYRSLATQSPDGIFLMDLSGNFLTVNQAMCNELGFSEAEFRSMNIWDMIPEQYLDLYRKRLTKILNGESLHEPAEYMVRGKDGKILYIEVISAPYYSEKGIIGFQGIARDITARKQAEAVLRASEERFRSILDNIEDGFYEVDTAGNFVFLNPALVRMLGRPANELMGMNNRLYMTPEGGKAVFQTFNRVFRTGIPEQAFDWDLVRPDGTLRSVEVSVSLSKAADGSINGFRGTVRDVTDRKHAEQTLIESNAQFRTLFESSPDAILLIDPHDRWSILDCNIAACQMNGYTRDELVGQSVDVLNLTPGDPTERVGYLERIRQSGVLRLETLHRRKDGTMFPVEVSTSMIALGGRDVVLGIDRDITERKQAEEALHESEEKFRNTIQQASDGILICDEQGRIDEWNKSQGAIFGLPREKMVGTMLWDFLYSLLPEDKRNDEQYQRLKHAALNAGQMENAAWMNRVNEMQVVNANGDVKTVLVNAFSITTRRGPLYASITSDITTRKQAEEALQQSEAQYRALVDQAADGIFIMDHQGHYLDVNTKGCAMLGYTREEMLGADYTLILLPEDLAQDPPKLDQLVAGQILLRERLYKRKDGTVFPIEISAKMLTDGRFQSIVRDITERKQAEEEIARLLAETIQHSQQQTALYHISTTLAQLRGRHELCQAVVSTARETLYYPFMGIFLVDPETGDRVLQALDGWDDVPADWRLNPGAGVSEKALVTGELQYWRDATQEATYVAGRHDTHSEVDVPIKIGDKVLGLLIVEDPRVDAFDADDFVVLQAVANQLAVALERVHLLEEQQALLAMTTRLYELSERILAAPTMAETARLVIETVLAGFAADACTINFFSETAGDTVGFRQSVGFSPTFHEQARHRPQGLTARVRTSKEPIIATAEELNPRVRAEGIQTNIALPLPGEKENIGALFVGYRQPHLFSAHERNLLSLFANQAALALRRMQLLHQIEQRLSELEAVNRISTILRTAQTREDALPILLDETLTALGTDAGAICLYHPDQNELRNFIARGWFRQFDDIPMKPGEGIVGTVFATGQAHITTEFKSDPIIRQQVALDGWGGVCLPIRAGALMVGTLTIALPPPRQITPEQMKLLESLTGMAGTTLHRMSLHEETVRQLDRLEALHNIDLAITASMDLQVTLNILLGHVKTQLNVDATSVLLLNPQLQTLEFAAGHGFRTRGAQDAQIRLGEDFAGRVALERRTIQADNLAQIEKSRHFAALWAGEGFAAYFGVPLIAKGKVKGVLQVFHRAPFHPEANWISFLETLAGQAAIAIDSTQLFENLQRSNADLELAYDTTIEGWSRALDLRDKETEGHTQRVTAITLRLAQTLGVGDAELVHVRRGALLHDIGKMGVPDEILLKPDKLTDEEWVLMRKHPQLAFALLSPINYLHAALDIPYCHHEKWDGTGYPRGLKGEQIPLVARIFAVVDVWDALTSDRPYRPAWAADKVIDHIRSLAGTHFDPQVVKVFLELEMLQVIAPALARPV